MLNSSNIVAIIPVRGGSKSFRKKNIINFCGRPLLAWTIDFALKSKFISDVFVTTDDQEVAEISREYGAKVVWRSNKIAKNTSYIEEALSNVISEIEKNRPVDTVVFLQATSPLREDSDIDEAIKIFSSENYDSLFSCSVIDGYCFWENKGNTLKSIKFDYKKNDSKQDSSSFLLENTSIYIFNREILKKHNRFLGGKIGYFSMPLWKSCKINDHEDIEICEYFFQKRILNKKENICLLKNVKLIVYDFDGVLTDNRVIVREDGFESVIVNRGDGLAIAEIKKIGIKQIILSTETNKVVEARAKKLDLPVQRGIKNKKEALVHYCKEKNVPLSKVVYLGNDLNDLEAMKIVGNPICPADACLEIKEISNIILNTPGGFGVVRDLVKFIDNSTH